MKRTFQLQIEGKKPERVLDSIKHEVRKYLKRERRRMLPVDTDYWDFDCKFGVSEESSEVVHLSAIITQIDEISKANGTQLYVEIIAKAVKRKPRVSTHASEDEGEPIVDYTQPNESNTPQPTTQPVAQ
jgi:hypothetical protein